MKAQTKTHKSLRLDDDLIKKIEVLAAKDNRNFNNMVEVLLEKAVKK